jgi:hypothetical protein
MFKIIKYLGIAEIIIGILSGIIIIYGLLTLKDGTWVIVSLIGFLILILLSLLSGTGILLNNKILFMSNFYLLSFISLQRISGTIELITSEKIGNPNIFRHYIIYNSVISVLILIVTFSLGLILLSKNVLNYYRISRRTAITQIIIAVFLYFTYFHVADTYIM